MCPLPRELERRYLLPCIAVAAQCKPGVHILSCRHGSPTCAPGGVAKLQQAGGGAGRQNIWWEELARVWQQKRRHPSVPHLRRATGRQSRGNVLLRARQQPSVVLSCTGTSTWHVGVQPLEAGKAGAHGRAAAQYQRRRWRRCRCQRGGPVAPQRYVGCPVGQQVPLHDSCFKNGAWGGLCERSGARATSPSLAAASSPDPKTNISRAFGLFAWRQRLIAALRSRSDTRGDTLWAGWGWCALGPVPLPRPLPPVL